MPQQAFRDPTPEWLKPEHASVLDSSAEKVIRALASVLGADNPQSQVMMLANPMETGPVGGAVGALGNLFSRLGRAVETRMPAARAGRAVANPVRRGGGPAGDCGEKGSGNGWRPIHRRSFTRRCGVEG